MTSDSEHETATGQHEVFDELVRAHGAALLAYATRLTGGDRGRAEDVVQETFLRAWNHLERLTTQPGSVHGWLRRVAHNLAVDGHRARQARPTELELTADHADRAAAWAAGGECRAGDIRPVSGPDERVRMGRETERGRVSRGTTEMRPVSGPPACRTVYRAGGKPAR